MDEEDRETCRNRRAPRYRDAPEMKAGFPFEPWHSTPVKKHTHDVSMARQTVRSPQMSCNHVSSLSHMEESKIPACEMEMVTIQKQRLELQLLMAELKDRDQELNDMAAAHQRQLQAWEQDRQRVLTLEQRCANLQDDLQTRNEVIRAISKHLKTVEAREKDRHRELTSAQQQLHELSQRQQHSSQQQRDLEEKNRSMNSTIMTLSSQVGQLQVQEEELSSMLKLKDKDVMEATSRILGLTGQMREYDATRKESETRESKILSEMEEYKHRFREARYDATRLKDELQEKTIENNSQREELIRLKQENQLLRKELQLAGESWKDELLGLARSKQERTVSELLCLRQVCANQQNDLQLLKLNLETTREALRRYEGQRSLERKPLHRGTAQPTAENSARSVLPASQDIPSELSFSCCEEVSRGSAPARGTGGAGPAPQPGPLLTPYCDCSSSPAENDCLQGAACRAGNEVGIMAVINYDAETGTPALLVGVGPEDPQCSCPGSVTCLYMDYSTPSPQRRSPGPTEDAVFNIIANGNQEECVSSTSRLQRLLAESRQMVASLEHTSGKPLSPAPSPVPSPAPKSDSVCSLHGSYNNSNSCNHSLSPRNSQRESQQSNDDTQNQSQHSNPRTEECGQ